jgi:hypothetical protein
MKEQRRRTTVDGRANTCAVVVRRWSVVCRANVVIPATSGRPESDGAGKISPQRHKGHKGEKMQARREHGGKEWLWLEILPSLLQALRSSRGARATEVAERAGPLHGAARWPPKRLSFIRQFNLHNSYFILALPPGGATGGGEKSGTRDFIEPIRSFEPTPERNPMARSASAQRRNRYCVP